MESTVQPGFRASHLSRLRIGTAGWTYKDWEGVFYPSGMQHKKIHPLEYLARFFDTAEVHASFDAPLKAEHAKLWAKRVGGVNANFRFTAKLYRAFTHSPIAVMEPTSAATIRPTDEDEVKTREGLDALAGDGKLGALVIQFPVSFKNTSLNREYLERLLRQFIEYPRVVEVHDSSWDNPETQAFFAQKNVAFCNIDPPVGGSSPASTGQGFAPLAYVRLDGRDPSEWFDWGGRDDRFHYLYKERELEAWKERIDHAAGKSQATYVITSNHVEGKAAVNALQLKAMLSRKRVDAPPTLIQRYPELRRFADPADDFAPGSSSELPLLA
jgi:uncharacterized protein YecE (DUF72 family)